MTPMDSLGSTEQPITAGGLQMPLPDPVKYSILGVSMILLLLALALLAWQSFRCFTQRQRSHTSQDTVTNELMYIDEKSSNNECYSGAPQTRVRGSGGDALFGPCQYETWPKSNITLAVVEDVSVEVSRLTRCLSGSSLDKTLTNEEAAVQKVEGSLRFSLYYDRQQRHLVVTVLEADGLQEQSPARRLQPSVTVRLTRMGAQGSEADGEGEGAPPVLVHVLQEWQTRTVKGSCNPLFGDQFSCTLQDDEELHDISLRMEVKDFDKFSRHTVLGEVRVPLGQVNISYPLELHEDLQTATKDLVGEMLLSLKFLPTSQRLEIGLLKVRTALTEMCSGSSMYARVSVQCNRCKLRYQKTSPVERGIVTVFNEVLVFSLPEVPLEQCQVLVSVYETDKGRTPAKHLIGQLTVEKGKSSEDKHWSLMMRSVRQPVARWHGLLL